jgi:hypothetical protein
MDEFSDGFTHSYAPTRWRRMRALNGHGQLLIGPDEHSDGQGAMVIAPPGVLLRAPMGGEPLTRDGWRQARWRPDEDGIVLVDQARPVGLVVVGLAQVVEDISVWAPEQLSWVVLIVERQLRILIGRMSRDCHGQAHSQAGTAYDDLVEIRRIADEAFGRLRHRSGEFPEWMLDGHFLRIQRTIVAELNADRKRHRKAMRLAGRSAEAGGRHLRLVTDVDSAIGPDAHGLG